MSCLNSLAKNVKTSMDYCQGRGLGGRICFRSSRDVRWHFGAIYQECESRFLCAGLKRAPCAATSPQAGAENQPLACGATTGGGGWVLLGSVVAKETRKKSAPRLAAATKADGRCGAETSPPGPGDLLRRGLILCPQRGRQPRHGEGGTAAICAPRVSAAGVGADEPCAAVCVLGLTPHPLAQPGQGLGAGDLCIPSLRQS